MKFKRNVLLKNYTTFKIGGPAKYFYIVKTKTELIEVIKKAKDLRLPFFILGGGSNLLVSDKGYKGLVIKIQNTKYKILNTKIVTEAGTMLGELVNTAVDAGLTGLEWAAGIPGTVGGAIRGNAGAFKKSIADIIKEVEVYDVTESRIMNYKLKDCKFDYRDSIFKKKKNLIILSITLQLKKGNKKVIKNKIKKNLKQRNKTQPLNFPSAGSIFKNLPAFPVGFLVKEDKSSSLPTERAKLSEGGKERIFLPFATARVIEKCGLKGKKIGKVKISEKHANFIVNLGQGKAKDVIKLIKLIKKKVKNKFRVKLEEEIQFLGFKNKIF